MDIGVTDLKTEPRLQIEEDSGTRPESSRETNRLTSVTEAKQSCKLHSSLFTKVFYSAKVLEEVVSFSLFLHSNLRQCLYEETKCICLVLFKQGQNNQEQLHNEIDLCTKQAQVTSCTIYCLTFFIILYVRELKFQ